MMKNRGCHTEDLERHVVASYLKRQSMIKLLLWEDVNIGRMRFKFRPKNLYFEWEKTVELS